MKKKGISDLILIEPRLKSTADHYLTYALDLGSAAKRKKIKTKIVTDRRIDKKVRRLLEENGIEVFPIFPTYLLTISNSRFINWPFLTFAYAIMALGLIRKYYNNAIVCTLSGNIEYLSVVSLLFSLFTFKNQLIVQMYVWESREYTSFTPKLIKIYRRLTEKIVKRAILKNKLILAGQGQEVAKHIQSRLGVHIPSLPFIIDWHSYPSVKPSKKPPYKIAFLGAMRAEKGFQQLVEAIPYVQSKVEYYFQVLLPSTLGEKKAHKLVHKVKRYKNCHIFEGEIAIDEYKEIISMMDIIVLPYRPEDFIHKTSNIFAEAIGLGKIVIAPAETSIGRALRDLDVGVIYTPYTYDVLADAIDHAVMHFDLLHKTVQKIMIEWKMENSADSFLSRLIAIKHNNESIAKYMEDN